MVFSSVTFLFIFLPLVVAAYYISPRKLRNIFLLVVSLLFYFFGEGDHTRLLIYSILMNYVFGFLIHRYRNRLMLAFALFCNLALLLYYKYFGFIVANIKAVFPQIKTTFEEVHLPIGISFFTFHVISYLVDIYRAKSKPQKNLINLSLYIVFFPQLIAGPIVRYNQIQKYLVMRREQLQNLWPGIERFTFGLAKKIILANPLSRIADAAFATPTSDLSASWAWYGIICYTLQIYFDFSGYSDMAIGLARVFGFRFEENFNYPYIARSVKEFWRRWHISLSNWFRDYLYIPLGGNRVSRIRGYFNLVTVFFLTGLWHGSSWNFVIWGLLHGGFLILERSRFVKLLESLPSMLQNFYTLFIVVNAWVFFRADSLPLAVSYLKAMYGFGEKGATMASAGFPLNHYLVFTSAVAILLITKSPEMLVRNLIGRFSLPLLRIVKAVFLSACLVLSMIFISSGTHNPFIYFRF